MNRLKSAFKNKTVSALDFVLLGTVLLIMYVIAALNTDDYVNVTFGVTMFLSGLIIGAFEYVRIWYRSRKGND